MLMRLEKNRIANRIDALKQGLNYKTRAPLSVNTCNPLLIYINVSIKKTTCLYRP